MATSARTDPQWLSPAEAALELNVSASTIRRWVAHGELPAFRVGATLRIPVRALTARKEANSGR